MFEAKDYDVTKKLGEGGFGETFLATSGDGQEVVLKRLRAAPLAPANARQPKVLIVATFGIVLAIVLALLFF